MSRIYISGPITNVDHYMERFCDAEKRLREQGYALACDMIIEREV